MQQSRLISFALLAPALLILLALFVYPLGFSLVSAFVDESGAWTFGNFFKAFEFYSRDILFTVVTADMAFRINAYGDYGVANALGFISYLMTGAVAWIYLRQGVREHRP